MLSKGRSAAASPSSSRANKGLACVTADIVALCMGCRSNREVRKDQAGMWGQRLGWER